MDKVVIEIGRVLFAVLFLGSGIAHLTKTAMLTGYAKYKKLPAAKLGVIGSGVFILLGGLSILTGLYVDLGALLLVIFLFPAAFVFHNFWAETDATAKQNEQTAFTKDLALAGAALIVFGLAVKGHGITPDNFGWVISKAHIALWK